MKHIAIEQVLDRAERAKSDSDYTYFFALLFAAEALAKTMVLGIVDRSDLGLRPSLGALRVRVQLPKVTKLGYPLLKPLSERRYGRTVLAATNGDAAAQDPIALRNG